jgi:hypothetical protein
MKIVAIGSIPLDLERTSFGTLSKSVKKGHEAYLIVAKDEGWRYPYMKALIESSKTIGISRVYFTDTFDYSAVTQNNANMIASFVKTINPSLVIMPFWKDANYKRKILAKTSLIACRGIGNIWMYELENNSSFLANIHCVISPNEVSEKAACLKIYRTLDTQMFNSNANKFILDQSANRLQLIPEAYKNETLDTDYNQQASLNLFEVFESHRMLLVDNDNF